MIDSSKFEHALYALYQGMCIARLYAYEGDSKSAASVLDSLEHLPKFLIEPFDRTADFRLALDGIAKTHNQQHLVDNFDSFMKPDW